MGDTPAEVVRNIGATVTTILLAVGLGMAGVYDVIASVKWGHDATVTEVVRQWSRDYPIIPFAVGALVGHLFWR